MGTSLDLVRMLDRILRADFNSTDQTWTMQNVKKESDNGNVTLVCEDENTKHYTLQTRKVLITYLNSPITAPAGHDISLLRQPNTQKRNMAS